MRYIHLPTIIISILLCTIPLAEKPALASIYCTYSLSNQQMAQFQNRVLNSSQLSNYQALEYQSTQFVVCFPGTFYIYVFYNLPTSYSQFGITYRLVVQIKAHTKGKINYIPYIDINTIKKTITDIESNTEVISFISQANEALYKKVDNDGFSQYKLQNQISVESVDDTAVFGNQIAFYGRWKSDPRLLELKYDYENKQITSFKITDNIKLTGIEDLILDIKSNNPFYESCNLKDYYLEYDLNNQTFVGTYEFHFFNNRQLNTNNAGLKFKCPVDITITQPQGGEPTIPNKLPQPILDDQTLLFFAVIGIIASSALILARRKKKRS